ncbi:major capsid protein [Chelonobacter oris]|uniref:phage major capsid protein, P2 family n=1 Tax=Chelonobacter oris TaxID=505317 RepID=UPI002447551D|nr:phage major capsid protein, P2 family [Chelonobacter oris]MDH3000948.1 major capsid protein [Chelonobacter oris]
MRNETKQKFNAYMARVAELNGITTNDVKEEFTVTPSVEQKLMEKVLKSSNFLQWINVVRDPLMEGEIVGLDVSAAIASTTDTDKEERQTKAISNLTSRRFKCEQVDFDTHIAWRKLDQWAKHPDFQQKLANMTQKTVALNLIMMGFNGVKRAAKSNLTANPRLEDVKKGWLQQLREDVPERVMNGASTGGKIKVGSFQSYDEQGNKVKDKGYENLDALVMDAVNSLIDDVYADDTDLVVICGREVLNDKYFQMVNDDLKPSENLASQLIISQKQIGGLKAVRVPFFPKNAMLITRLDNLSLYIQEGSMRRFIINNPKRNRIEDFLSQNIDYKVEEYGCAALIEKIELEDLPDPRVKPQANSQGN